MLLLATMLVGSGVSAQAAMAAKSVELKLSPATIVADGKSTSIATANVTNTRGNAVAFDDIIFTSDSGQFVGATTNHLNGTYTATITSTTMAGKSTVTATDTTAGKSDTATLTQASGPAANIALRRSPSTVVADGASTSIVTATVTDAFGNSVPAALIAFSSSDHGVRFSPVHNIGNGTYTTTLTSSKTAGSVSVTATDSATGVSGTLMLTQNATPTGSGAPNGSASMVTLSSVPAAPVTNQVVTLIAIITASGGGTAPSGTITFEDRGTPIAGCANQPALAQATQRLSEGTCQVSFSASTSPKQLKAIFTSRSPNVAASSTTATVTVGPSDTSTFLDIANPTVGVGSTATFTAQVDPNNVGPAVPSGSVDFFDGTEPIAACSNRPITTGAGASTASCTVGYKLSGRHSITARYGGDANFRGSGSAPPQPVTVHVLPLRVMGTIKATMQWTFLYTPKYTKVEALVVNHAPIGAKIAVTCHGRGCPFATRVNSVRAINRCRSTSSHRCPARYPGMLDLHGGFRDDRLMVGAQVVVKITRPRWIGKYYRFTVRAGHPPLIRIDCLGPGGTRPGVGC